MIIYYKQDNVIIHLIVACKIIIPMGIAKVTRYYLYHPRAPLKYMK